jgi:putative hydrolase of the HAD superfamily
VDRVSVRAVLVDALGTLVRLEPPAPRLRAGLRRVAGVDVGEEAAERAFRAEIAYYLEHHLEGRDRASLDDLRGRCAMVIVAELREHGVQPAAARAALLGSLEFTAFDDAAPALRALRDGGVRIVVASNWDCSLPEFLERSGLLELVDGVVSSAVVGRAKPAPEVFLAALREAGAVAEEALHVGDSLENDVGGARAAGIRAVLLARAGAPPAGVESVRSLAEVPSLVFGR